MGRRVAVPMLLPVRCSRLITDIDRLPEWNAAIESVIERPSELATGSEWVVKMHPARGMSWKSRSSVQEIDPEAFRFAYRTVNADGNPSYPLWTWEIVAVDSGANRHRELGRLSQDPGSQVAGGTDSTTTTAQGSRRITCRDGSGRSQLLTARLTLPPLRP